MDMGHKRLPNIWLWEDQPCSHVFCVSPCQFYKVKLALVRLHPSYLAPKCHKRRNAEQLPTTATDLCVPNQASKSQQLTRAAKRNKNHNVLFMALGGAGPLQLRASAAISVYNKSFPICFCPQMLWLRRNMFWLRISKQCYRSSEGQSCCWGEHDATERCGRRCSEKSNNNLMLTELGRSLDWRQTLNICCFLESCWL